METKTAMAIAEIKQEMRLTEWAEQIQPAPSESKSFA